VHCAQIFGHGYGNLSLWKFIQDGKIWMGTILQAGSTSLESGILTGRYRNL